MGVITGIAVSQEHIRWNANNGDQPPRPPIMVHTDEGLVGHYFTVEIRGPSHIVYGPNTPTHMKYGARVWIETESEVVGK